MSGRACDAWDDWDGTRVPCGNEAVGWQENFRPQKVRIYLCSEHYGADLNPMDDPSVADVMEDELEGRILSDLRNHARYT